MRSRPDRQPLPSGRRAGRLVACRRPLRRTTPAGGLPTLPRCAAAEDEPPRAAAGLSPRVGRVVTFIDEHLGEALSLDRLAAEAELSKYYFARRFREETGLTPWAYVRRARVEKAKELLERGAAPAEAAVAAGFFDQSHLTNTMKALDGQTPGRFRSQHLDEPRPAHDAEDRV